MTSHLLATFRPQAGLRLQGDGYAIAAIGILGFVVWGHHMFVSGMSPYSAFVFSVLTMCIGVPSAIKTFNWIGTLWGGQIRFTSPMLYSIGFVSLFVSGGLSGIFLGQPTIDLYFHDTYFVVAHFHLIMAVAAIFGMFAGVAFWFPKMFGRWMDEGLGKIHFWCTFIGVYAIFGPMHYLGMLPHPAALRRVHRRRLLADGQRRGTALLHYDRGDVYHHRAIPVLFNFVKSIFAENRVRKPTPGKRRRSNGRFLPASHDNFGARFRIFTAARTISACRAQSGTSPCSAIKTKPFTAARRAEISAAARAGPMTTTLTQTETRPAPTANGSGGVQRASAPQWETAGAAARFPTRR